MLLIKVVLVIAGVMLITGIAHGHDGHGEKVNNLNSKLCSKTGFIDKRHPKSSF